MSKRLAVGLAAALLLAGTFQTHAQAQAPGQSSRVIELSVHVEQANVSLEGMVVEGDRFLLSHAAVGSFAITPAQAGADGRTFRVTVEKASGAPGSERFTVVETVVASLGEPARLQSIRGATVVIERVRQRTAPAARGSGPAERLSPTAARPLASR